MTSKATARQIIQSTQRWLETVVIALNLCPFARRALDRGGVRFAVTDAQDTETLLEALLGELDFLDAPSEIETTLLIHPEVLQEFYAYNDFLSIVEVALETTSRHGVYQVASFHPEYQFAGTSPADAENYSNRSPYPMLHILRESSITRAVETHPDVHGIPDVNIERLRLEGAEEMRGLLERCSEAELY